MNYLILNDAMAIELDGELVLVRKADLFNVYLGGRLPIITQMMEVDIITRKGVIVLTNRYGTLAVNIANTKARWQNMRALPVSNIGDDPGHSYTRAICAADIQSIDFAPAEELVRENLTE